LRRIARCSAVLGQVLRLRSASAGFGDRLLGRLHPRSTGGVRGPGAILVGGDDYLGVGVASSGVGTGVGRSPVGPRTVVSVATVDGDEAGVVLDGDVRPTIGRQRNVTLRFRFAASQQVGRNATGSPDGICDDVGELVPTGALDPLAGDRFAVDTGCATGDEVVTEDELAFDGVVGTLHAVAEAVLGFGLLVLELLVGLVRRGGSSRELLYRVGRCGLPGVHVRVAVDQS